MGSWKKWSMTNTVSKPDSSAAWAASARMSKSSAAGRSGNVKLGSWSPALIMVYSVDLRSGKHDGDHRAPLGPVGRRDPAAVRLDQVADDRQAEPAPPRVERPGEAVEHLGQLVGR